MAVGRFTPLLLTLALVAPAAAQSPAATSAPGMSAPDARAAHDPSARREEWRAHMQAHEAQEAADIALLLRLRPDQQAGFQAWTASMKPPEGEHGREHSTPGAPQADVAAQTTPQELDRMQARMAEHEARARVHLDATRRFYASLSPEQQTLFDALMRLDHHSHDLRGGGWGEGRSGHGGAGPMGDGGPPPPPGS